MQRPAQILRIVWLWYCYHFYERMVCRTAKIFKCYFALQKNAVLAYMSHFWKILVSRTAQISWNLMKHFTSYFYNRMMCRTAEVKFEKVSAITKKNSPWPLHILGWCGSPWGAIRSCLHAPLHQRLVLHFDYQCRCSPPIIECTASDLKQVEGWIMFSPYQTSVIPSSIQV